MHFMLWYLKYLRDVKEETAKAVPKEEVLEGSKSPEVEIMEVDPVPEISEEEIKAKEKSQLDQFIKVKIKQILLFLFINSDNHDIFARERGPYYLVNIKNTVIWYIF